MLEGRLCDGECLAVGSVKLPEAVQGPERVDDGGVQLGCIHAVIVRKLNERWDGVGAVLLHELLLCHDAPEEVVALQGFEQQ